MVRGQLRDRAERRPLSPVGGQHAHLTISRCVLSVETALGLEASSASLGGAIPISYPENFSAAIRKPSDWLECE